MLLSGPLYRILFAVLIPFAPPDRRAEALERVSGATLVHVSKHVESPSSALFEIRWG
jgi:hypothetical protein